jgi:hypothetical protein
MPEDLGVAVSCLNQAVNIKGWPVTVVLNKVQAMSNNATTYKSSKPVNRGRSFICSREHCRTVCQFASMLYKPVELAPAARDKCPQIARSYVFAK